MTLTTIVFGIVCFLLGSAVGALLFVRLSPELRKNRDIQKHLYDKQDELKNYQLEVTQHFAETARLLKQMAESYRDVHNHLAAGAEKLGKDSHGQPVLKKLPEIDEITDRSEDAAPLTPPLDYAPKSSPYDRSTLNEEYGLEKVELEEKPFDDIADAIAANARQAP
ncbi:MAG TPA: DUF1043 family protein [Pseudomonadales bacterium]